MPLPADGYWPIIAGTRDSKIKTPGEKRHFPPGFIGSGGAMIRLDFNTRHFYIDLDGFTFHSQEFAA